MRDFCCPNCFQDPTLQKFVNGEAHKPLTQCYWCTTRETRGIACSELQDRFTQVVHALCIRVGESSYSEREGANLADLLQEKTDAFSVQVYENDKHRELLSNIVNHGPMGWDDPPPLYDPSEEWVDRSLDDGSAADLLESCLETVREFVCRYGHSRTPDDPALQDKDVARAWSVIKAYFWRSTYSLLESSNLYRARIQHGDAAIQLDQIGAPKPEDVSVGRANHTGQPVLYLADTAETALAEVRPALRETVAVAEFQPLRALTLLSLLPVKMPFSLFEDPDNYVAADDQENARATLAEAYARPVTPQDSPRQYLFTQVLSNIARELFDGIAFPSAQRRGGVCFVLFNPDLALPRKLQDPRHVINIEYQTETRARPF